MARRLTAPRLAGGPRRAADRVPSASADRDQEDGAVVGGQGHRPGDDELPPDPWDSDPGWRSSSPRPQHPQQPQQPEAPQQPQAPQTSRSAFQHPALWIGLVVLALVLLVGALLEPSPSPPREPAPDAVTTSAVTTGAGDPRV